MASSCRVLSCYARLSYNHALETTTKWQHVKHIMMNLIASVETLVNLQLKNHGAWCLLNVDVCSKQALRLIFPLKVHCVDSNGSFCGSFCTIFH